MFKCELTAFKHPVPYCTSLRFPEQPRRKIKQIWTSLRAAVCRLVHRRLLNSDAHSESLVAAVRYLVQDRATTAATVPKQSGDRQCQRRASSGSSFGFSDGEEYLIYPVPPRGTWLLQKSREETIFRTWREAAPRYHLP